MDIIRAREIIRLLAEGVDPGTGEVLPTDSVYNSPDVIRALYTIWEATASIHDKPTDSLRNAGKPWSDIEDDKLRDEFATNTKIANIAIEHGRSYGAIESRLEHLGLKKKPFCFFGTNKKHGRLPHGSRPT